MMMEMSKWGARPSGQTKRRARRSLLASINQLAPTNSFLLAGTMPGWPLAGLEGRQKVII